MSDTEVDGLPAAAGGGRGSWPGPPWGWPSAPPCRGSPAWPGSSPRRRRWAAPGSPTATTWPTPRPTSSPTSSSAGCCRPRSCPCSSSHLTTRREEGGVAGHLRRGHRHRHRPGGGHRRLLHPRPRDHQPLHGGQPQPRRAQPTAGGRLPPAVVRAPVDLLRAHRPVHRPVEHPGQVRRPDVRPDRQQPGGDRGAGLVPRPGPPPQPGLDRHQPPRSRAPGARHHARGRRAGRPAGPLADPGRPPRPLPLAAGARGDADHRPPGRLDVRLGGGQPGRPVRHAGPGRRGQGAGGGVGLHLRLHLLPAPLRRGGGVGHERGHAVAVGPVGHYGTSPASVTGWPSACGASWPSSSPPPSAC